jgi:molecular chaperone DnaK
MSEPVDGPIIGIDLGTTNSVVAAVVDGRAEVLMEDGQSILPSVVGLDPQGKLITGTVARNQQVAFPDRTIASVKRRMGSMEPLKLGDRQFTPPEISAMILRRLRQRATDVLGTPVQRAVITVPAFFDEAQRQATREAGTLAGLKVERIINEPTAATLVYHAGTSDRVHLVVYDFGGGTFDVSVVRMESGVVEVLSSKGDTSLGGDDLDAALMKHVADEFYAQHGMDLRKNATTRWRLLQACEQAKKDLSSAESADIREEFIAEIDGKPVNLNLTVTRHEYEQLIDGKIGRTVECVDEALRDAGLTLNQIDELVLVGGSTRTPLVQQKLRAEFNMEPSRSVDPDLAVSLGAATQAAMIDGQAVGPVLIDVTTHTLGIEVMEGIGFTGPELGFSPIIHRNTPLPARHEEAYRPVHEKQDSAEIHVLQGEHQELARNQSIGKMNLELKAADDERSKIVVRFELTLDGTLKVTAMQPATGQSEELTINNAISKFRDEDRSEAALRLEDMFNHSDEISDRADSPSTTAEVRLDEASQVPPPHEVPSAADAMLCKARRAGETVEGDDGEEIRELANELESAIADGDQDRIADLCGELDDVLFYVGQ